MTSLQDLKAQAEKCIPEAVQAIRKDGNNARYFKMETLKTHSSNYEVCLVVQVFGQCGQVEGVMATLDSDAYTDELVALWEVIIKTCKGHTKKKLQELKKGGPWSVKLYL